MATYITLWKYTRDGLIDIRHMQERFDSVKAVYQQNGGKLTSAYSLIGPYDIMTIGELPDERALTRTVLQICAKGRVTAQTMSALQMADFITLAQET